VIGYTTIYLAVFNILALDAANGSFLCRPLLLPGNGIAEVVIVVVVFAVLKGFGLKPGVDGESTLAGDFGGLVGEALSEEEERVADWKDLEDASWWRRKKKM